MSHRGRRLAARFLVLGLLAATLFAVDSLASPSPAEARCKGVDTPVYSWFSPGEGVAASETPGTGTCNGNNIYSGTLKDEKSDGYCVYVLFMETGTGWLTPDSDPPGRVCGNGNTKTFQWTDFNGNSRAYEKFCLQTLNPPYESICGWGNDVEFPGHEVYALNWGY
jgi:hypothetical protein